MKHKLRNDGEWSNCPNVNQNDSEAWLDNNWANNANDNYGSFVCAWDCSSY